MAEATQLPMASPPSSEESSNTPVDARRFRVEGMDCAACAQTVQRRVEVLDGVRAAEVSYGNASLTVEGEIADGVIVGAVSRAGYRAYPATLRRSAHRRAFWRRDARVVSTMTAIPLLIAAVVGSLLDAPSGLASSLYLLSMVVAGWPIARAAAGALAVRRLDMNVLMALAAFGAVAIGEYAEAAWVLVLFSVGMALESFALDRTRHAVESLMDLAPTEARILVDGREQTVPAEVVGAGDLLIVRPGERLPVDGRVVEGSSSVDQSPITGESVPIEVGPGDEVYGGSLAVHGTLTIMASRPAAESALSRIAAMVEDAQASRAPSERFIDRFAAIYTPLVFAAALVLALMPPLVFGGDFGTWIYRALALLIVACPCSLVISVPVAVVSAIGGAAREGVLITNGQALENLGRIDTVALDKTGTLTLGSPELERVIVLDPELTEADALTLMAAVEQHSEHPLGAALVRAARERDIPIPSAEDFQALPGRGAQGIVDGRRLWAGGPRLSNERLDAVPDEVAKLHASGQTALILATDDRPLALFGVADQLRDEAPAVIADLDRAGIGRTVMLTGDSEPIARSIAHTAGIGEWRAGLLPKDKLQAIDELATNGVSVAMVGDGINDAPALAAAPVGIAMGAAGSDTAIAAADVALLSDRLDRLPSAIRRARRALSVMRANVVASLAVKGVLVLLAPFGYVTLVIAVAADMGMSLAVTLNALRLLRGERDRDSPVNSEG